MKFEKNFKFSLTQKKIPLMFFDSVLSNSFLILVSSSSIYVLGKQSYEQHANFQLHFISASIGIFGFCVRSTGSLIYNLFFRTYPIDPREMEDETSKKEDTRKKPFRNRSLFHRIFSTMGLTGLTYAFYRSNQSKILGSICVFSLTMLESICAIETWNSERETNEEIIEERSSVRIFAEASDGFLDFYWIVIGGFYGWIKGNSFGLLAFLPYSIAVLILSSEEFEKNPTVQAAFNDYMIIAHILLMTEAIRQAPSTIVEEIVN